MVERRKGREPEKIGYLTREEELTVSTDMLVRSHSPMVRGMATKFARYGIDYDDLVQEGNIGLIIAAEKFDRERGFRFSTYARWWVAQRMRDAVFALNSVVKLPSTKEHKRKFFKEERHRDTSLHATVASTGLTLIETLASPEPLQDVLVEGVIDTGRRDLLVRQALTLLKPRELEIIQARHLSDDQATLDALGQRFGLSKERIRQIETAAIAKLRKEIMR